MTDTRDSLDDWSYTAPPTTATADELLDDGAIRDGWTPTGKPAASRLRRGAPGSVVLDAPPPPRPATERRHAATEGVAVPNPFQRFSPHEWNALTHEQKAAVFAARAQR